MRLLTGILVGLLLSLPANGQTPQPFPRPGQPASPPAPGPRTPAAPAPSAPATPAADAAGPSAKDVWFPVYPAAQYLATYDAGRGQKYYLYGATAPFTEVVAYYRTQLDEKGSLIFKEPPTHMFEVGRFREETMAFPPGVTVKDWTWGGSSGYLNPRLRGEPARFPTVVMIVPPPPGEQK